MEEFINGGNFSDWIFWSNIDFRYKIKYYLSQKLTLFLRGKEMREKHKEIRTHRSTYMPLFYSSYKSRILNEIYSGTKYGSFSYGLWTKIGLSVVCKRLNYSIKTYASPSVPDGRPTTNLGTCPSYFNSWSREVFLINKVGPRSWTRIMFFMIL